jgi:hypothetical protein
MRAWLAPVLIAIAGCSFGAPEAQTIDNSCANDADCSAGVCDGNICVDDSGATVEVAIEVLRPANDLTLVTPASWAFAVESVSGADTRDLDLPPTRVLRGAVRWDGARVPATLRFVRRMAPNAALLAPLAVEVETLRESISGEDGETHDFEAVLIAGETYDVHVMPSSDMVVAPTAAAAPAVRSLPPLYMELQVGDEALDVPLRFDVTFPADLAAVCAPDQRVSCTLEAEVLSVDVDVEEAEAGLQVRAVEENTGRVLSSIGETDELGRFAIRIGETQSKYLIRVTSSVGREPFPAVSVDPEIAFANDPVEKRIYIPKLRPVHFTGRVRDAEEKAVSGATVRFLSTGIFGGSLLGLQGSFSGSATTDAEGRFGTELLPGFYSIVVTPPEDAEKAWGILSAEALVGEEVTATEALIVPEQIVLRGWVGTFSDEPAAGATILARARSVTEQGVTHRSQQVVSNELGAFAMSIDAGLYDVQVKVPSESGFAWLVEAELVVSPNASELQRGFRLDPPIPLRGVLRSSDGAVVANAPLRAYILTTGEDGITRPLQVAETVSGEDGSYRLLIAPRLGAE